MTRYSSTMREVLSQIREGATLHMKEEKFAGWIAFFKGKKLEIKKGEANDLYGAKLKAIKDLKVPKSQVGLLAIEPAYEEFVKEAPEDMEPASPDEGSMADQQLEFIAYAAKEIKQHIANGGEFPEWMQNKLAKVNGEIQSLHANIDHGKVESVKEETLYEDDFKVGDKVKCKASGKTGVVSKVDPSGTGAYYTVKRDDGEVMKYEPSQLVKEGKSSTGYELYHKDFSTAMQHAYDFAKKKFGITVDPDEIDTKVAMGPRKPSKGKTNSYRLKGDKGAIQVQVYGMDNGKYELNMYKEEVELGEAFAVNIKKGGKVPVGQWTFIYKTEKPPKYIENSIKGYDKDAKVVTKGDEVHVTASAGAHNSLIDSMRKLRVNGSVSEAVELGEGAFSELQITAKELAKYAMKSGGVDKNDFMKAAAMMKQGKVQELGKFTMDLDTEPRDKIIDMVKGAVGKSAAEKLFNVSIREEVELTEKLKVSDGLGAWITDFHKSDAPQFAGKSKEERQKMAIAAFVDAGGKLEQASEKEVDVFHKKLDKLVHKSFGHSSDEKKDVKEAVDAKKVVDYLVKKGNNPKEAESMVKKELAGAIKAYPNAPVAKVAEYIRSVAEEGEEPQKSDQAKKVDSEREDKKKTKIAQLQLQIAKATEMINRINRQSEIEKMNKGEG